MSATPPSPVTHPNKQKTDWLRTLNRIFRTTRIPGAETLALTMEADYGMSWAAASAALVEARALAEERGEDWSDLK